MALWRFLTENGVGQNLLASAILVLPSFAVHHWRMRKAQAGMLADHLKRARVDLRNELRQHFGEGVQGDSAGRHSADDSPTG